MMTDPIAGEESTEKPDRFREWFQCPSCLRSCYNICIDGIWRCELCFPPIPEAGREATTDAAGLRPQRYAVEFRDCSDPCAEGNHEWTRQQRDGMQKFALKLLRELAQAEAQLAAQPSVQRTQEELKAEMATLTAAETGSAWQLLYGLYGELPIPEKDGWKIAALLIRVTAERGSK